MDWIVCRNTLPVLFKRYRYICVAILIGILLMVLPECNQNASQKEISESPAMPTMEQSLEEILSSVYGAGRVEVMLSQEESARTLYQTDEVRNENDVRRDTVLVTDKDRCEQGLVEQIRSPVYRGAVILCQGADNAYVKLSMVEAVKSITGLSSDRITVLKMK